MDTLGKDPGVRLPGLAGGREGPASQRGAGLASLASLASPEARSCRPAPGPAAQKGSVCKGGLWVRAAAFIASTCFFFF